MRRLQRAWCWLLPPVLVLLVGGCSRGGDIPSTSAAPPARTGISVPSRATSAGSRSRPFAATAMPSSVATVTARITDSATATPSVGSRARATRAATPRAVTARRAAGSATPRPARTAVARAPSASIRAPRARRTAVAIASAAGPPATDPQSATQTPAAATADAGSTPAVADGGAVSATTRTPLTPTVRLPRASGAGATATPGGVPAPTRRASSRSARVATAASLPDGAVLPNGRSCPAEAPVKLSRAGVYHTPASRTYATLQPVLCFTTPAAAQAAGYRNAKN
jgi:hypothetical protein